MRNSHNRKKTIARETFGKRLRNKRLELGLTQEELADRSNLHPTYVGSVERGERNISFENILVLAKGLNTSPKDLMPPGEKVGKQPNPEFGSKILSEKKLCGKRLKNKRLELDLTQAQLAEKANMDHSYIGAVERGEKNIGLENLIALASALEIAPEDLMPE